ncbi:hypothetical protein SprV_0602199300 [Sparganum proliferum]
MVVVVAYFLAGETTPSVHLLGFNSHLWLYVARLCSAATPRANASTGGLNQTSPSSTSSPPPSRRPTRRHHTGRVSPHTLAAWNVRPFLDNPRSNRPERRTALVARELVRYKVDIAALSETRFSEQGQLEEVGAGYTFFWSARPRSERRGAGVAFAIRNDIVGRLPCLLQGINDRLMSLRLPLRGGKFATIICAHASPDDQPRRRRKRQVLRGPARPLGDCVEGGQQRLLETQDAWTAPKAEEIQGYADRNEWKNFFSAIKAVYGPPTKGTAPLLSADGSTLLTEKTQILQRWAEHFRGVRKRPSSISPGNH